MFVLQRATGKRQQRKIDDAIADQKSVTKQTVKRVTGNEDGVYLTEMMFEEVDGKDKR